jgi:hypothetical protein
MINIGDLKRKPFFFREGNLESIVESLRSSLPKHVTVSLGGYQKRNIEIRGGKWRGVRLTIDDSSSKLRLKWMQYFIPSFASKVLLFIATVVVTSILMTIIVSAVVGQFVTGVFGAGGILGAGMYTILEQLVVVPQVRSLWDPELHPAIESLLAPPTKDQGAASVVDVADFGPAASSHS